MQNDLEFIPPLESENLAIASGFGERMHPYFKKKMLHTGVDFVSVESGAVLDSSYDSARGNYIIIQHNDEFVTTYSHLKD